MTARGPHRVLFVALGALLALALVVSGCTGDDSESSPDPTEAPGPRPGGVLRAAVAAPAFPLDPALASPTDTGAAMIAELLHGRLTSTSPDGTVVEPALAESWELSPDATVVTFRLRGDARFSDGSPVTGADVVASLQRVAALGPASLPSARLDAVAGYDAFAVAATAPTLTGLTAPDPATVVVTLSRPEADLPALLAAPAFAIRPAAAVAAEAPALVAPVAGQPAPVTSGPYRWAEGDGARAVLVRADGVDPAAAPLDRVELRRTDDLEAAADLWAAGDVDVTALPVADASSTVPPGVGVVSTDPLGAVWWFGMNLEAGGVADARVRRAVALALDRPALVELLAGPIAVDGLVAPQVPGGEVVCGVACTRDVAAARALLAEVGVEAPIPLTLDVYDDPTLVAVAEAAAAQLTEVGFAASVRARPFEEYRDGVLVADRQMFWFGWPGLAPTAGAYLEPTFRADAPDNVVGLRSPEVDAALAAAASTVDPERRGQRWAEAHRLVLDQMVAVPIAQARAATAVASAVQGFELRLDGTPVLRDLWLAPPEPPEDTETD